jgi:hypothetical protein
MLLQYSVFAIDTLCLQYLGAKYKSLVLHLIYLF